jgi:hypothetical protein
LWAWSSAPSCRLTTLRAAASTPCTRRVSLCRLCHKKHGSVWQPICMRSPCLLLGGVQGSGNGISGGRIVPQVPARVRSRACAATGQQPAGQAAPSPLPRHEKLWVALSVRRSRCAAVPLFSVMYRLTSLFHVLISKSRGLQKCRPLAEWRWGWQGSRWSLRFCAPSRCVADAPRQPFACMCCTRPLAEPGLASRVLPHQRLESSRGKCHLHPTLWAMPVHLRCAPSAAPIACCAHQTCHICFPCFIQ